MRHYLVFKDQTLTGVNEPYSHKVVEASTPGQRMLGVGQAPEEHCSESPIRQSGTGGHGASLPRPRVARQIRLRNRMHPWNIGHLRRFSR